MKLLTWDFSSMARITLGFGVALILVGLASYFRQEEVKSITALIPAFVGAVFLLLGLMALKDSLRKHAMHFAAMVGLVGIVGAGYRVVKKFYATNEVDLFAAGMAALCLVYLALCIRSFITARRARAQKAPV